MIGMTPAASDDEIEAPPRCGLASIRARGGERSVLEIGDRRIGGERFVIAGLPQSLRCDDFACFVAHVEQVAEIAGNQLAVVAR